MDHGERERLSCDRSGRGHDGRHSGARRHDCDGRGYPLGSSWRQPLRDPVASPTFASWREGTTLDLGVWLTPRGGRTPAVIVSAAHLDDAARGLVLGVLLEELLSWVRTLPGSNSLRALVVFDEVYGFLPPHPANPPTKRPMVALMKQARAFGVRVVVATQNPMDLDYRALGNAGLWCIGLLQTDGDCARVMDGLASAAANDHGPAEPGRIVKNLSPRWFLMRDVHSPVGTLLLQPRWAMSVLWGPMTRGEIQRARAMRAGEAQACPLLPATVQHPESAPQS